MGMLATGGLGFGIGSMFSNRNVANVTADTATVFEGTGGPAAAQTTPLGFIGQLGPMLTQTIGPLFTVMIMMKLFQGLQGHDVANPAYRYLPPSGGVNPIIIDLDDD
jgi:hypothetical protein